MLWIVDRKNINPVGGGEPLEVAYIGYKNDDLSEPIMRVVTPLMPTIVEEKGNAFIVKNGLVEFELNWLNVSDENNVPLVDSGDKETVREHLLLTFNPTPVAP